jgi:hypothetical protein
MMRLTIRAKGPLSRKRSHDSTAILDRVSQPRPDMPTTRGRALGSGKCDAFRPPEELAFGENAAPAMIRSGEALTAKLGRQTPAGLVDRLGALSTPSIIECREVDTLPERPNL